MVQGHAAKSVAEQGFKSSLHFLPCVSKELTLTSRLLSDTGRGPSDTLLVQGARGLGQSRVCDLPPGFRSLCRQRWARAEPGWACGHRQPASIIDTASEGRDGGRLPSRGGGGKPCHTHSMSFRREDLFFWNIRNEECHSTPAGLSPGVQTLLRLLRPSSPAAAPGVRHDGALLGLLAPVPSPSELPHADTH